MLACPECGGRMKLIAFIAAPRRAEAYLACAETAREEAGGDRRSFTQGTRGSSMPPWTRRSGDTGGPSAAQLVELAGAGSFEARLKSDQPYLRITAERGPRGDRWQATIRLDPAVSAPGPIAGTIWIETNDREVPLLKVPVTGTLVDS